MPEVERVERERDILNENVMNVNILREKRRTAKKKKS